MKKFFLAAAFGAAGLSLASCGGGQKEKDKQAFIQTCMQQGGAAMAGDMKSAFEEYCKCSAEKVLDKYSKKEIDEMEAEARRTGNGQAMMAKLQPVFQPCLDDLQAKAMKMNGGAGTGAAQ